MQTKLVGVILPVPLNIHGIPYSSSVQWSRENQFKLVLFIHVVNHKNRTGNDDVHFISVQFLRTKPYACEPSSLPKYAPNKEMDAKL